MTYLLAGVKVTILWLFCGRNMKNVISRFTHGHPWGDLIVNTFCGQIFVNYDIFVSKCAVSLDIFFKFAHTNDVLSAQFLMELDGADRHGL